MSKLIPPSPSQQPYKNCGCRCTPTWWIKLQNAIIWWFALVVTYSVARFPLGLAIESIRHVRGDWTIAAQMRVADAIVYYPFALIGRLLHQLDSRPVLLVWIVGLYFGGLFLTWFCLGCRVLLRGVNDVIRTFLDNR